MSRELRGTVNREGVAVVYRDVEYDILPAPGRFAEALIINDLGWVYGYHSRDDLGPLYRSE